MTVTFTMLLYLWIDDGFLLCSEVWDCQEKFSVLLSVWRGMCEVLGHVQLLCGGEEGRRRGTGEAVMKENHYPVAAHYE